MPAKYAREQANKCLELARNSTNPELIEQLELWAAELHLIADTAERNTLIGYEPEVHPGMRDRVRGNGVSQ